MKRMTLLLSFCLGLSEPKTSPSLTTYKGRGMIVVRSDKAAGKAVVTVTSPALKMSKSETLVVK